MTNQSTILDIETLDTTPTSIITEIALISFDRETLQVIDELVIVPDFFEQLANGRTTSADTIEFHRRQRTLPGTPPRDDLPPPRSALLAAVEISEFFAQNPARRVWIQGTCFDRPVLEDFFSELSLPLPWEFWKSRDARTAWDMAFPDKKHAPRPHRALADCHATLADLTAALRRLNALESI